MEVPLEFKIVGRKVGYHRCILQKLASSNIEEGRAV